MHAIESDERARRAGYPVLAIAVAVRLAAAALMPLAPDETYYWEWSRHIAAGYLDHPPLIAFAIRLGTLVLGATPLGVRLGSVLAGALEAKYTALLLGAGLVAALLAQPALRRALAAPGPYLAAALALAMFAPNLIWNAQHGWLSFDYQLAHGLALHRLSLIHISEPT